MTIKGIGTRLKNYVWLGRAIERTIEIFYPPRRNRRQSGVMIGGLGFWVTVGLIYGLAHAARFVSWAAVVVLLTLGQGFHLAFWGLPRAVFAS